MTKERIARIQDLVGLSNALYPPGFAESWDNVGLHAGDPAAELRRALVCLDPTEEALEAALEADAQAIVSHHPLIFKPLKSVVPVDEAGRVICRAIRADIAVFCAHTNLDRAPAGLNDWLGCRLGLESMRPLAPGGEGELVKLVVFVPLGYEEKVAQALFRGGAGKIGRYDHCSFLGRGTGTFRPEEGTDPFLGRIGETERTAELRLETIVPRSTLSRALARMQRAHPYEEVAYDLIPLDNRREDVGLGRIGKLSSSTPLCEFADRVKSALGCSSLRVVGDPERPVGKIAVCGGSGASLLAEADRQGADVLVTGDVKYHEARSAMARGLALIDAGHFATEHLMVEGLAEALAGKAAERGLEIEFIAMEGERDPFRTL